MPETPEKVAPERVKCPTCGVEHDKGAPHHPFCPGCPPDAECALCGAKGGEAVAVFKCQECDEVCCEDCGDDCERLCDECMDGAEEEDE